MIVLMVYRVITSLLLVVYSLYMGYKALFVHSYMSQEVVYGTELSMLITLNYLFSLFLIWLFLFTLWVISFAFKKD